MSTQNTQASLFHSWFKAKRYYPVLLIRKGCPLSFGERLVYSYLVYRAAKGGARSVGEIARATGIERSRSLPGILRSLTDQLLIAREGGLIVALEPQTKDWWVWRPDMSKVWYQRLRGFPVCWTPTILTPMQTAIYFCLLNPNIQTGRKIRHSQKKAGIAAMMGVSRDTVQRTWTKLEELKFLEYDYLRTPTKEVLATFQDRPQTHKAWLLSEAIEGIQWGRIKDGPTMAKWIDGYASMMAKARYTKEEILSYWDNAIDLANGPESLYQFMVNWDTMFQKIEAQSATNRASGSFKAKNSLGLLNIDTQLAIAEIHKFKGTY